MGKKLQVRLNSQSIKQAIAELEQYKSEVPSKMERFLKELADVGIKAATTNTDSVLGAHITYTKKVITKGGNECVISMIGRDDGTMTSSWYVSDTEVKTVPVSAILMAEVGSGKYASTEYNIPSSGRGTFPEQRHAWEDQWHYKDETGWHTTSGIQPTHPMHSAALAMRAQIEAIGKKVFGS